MANTLSMMLGYALASGETAANAAQRFGVPVEAVKALAGGIVELPLAIDVSVPTPADAAKTLEAELERRFRAARRTSSTSHGITTFRLETTDETFDVFRRGDRVYVLTFDSFGGFADIVGGAVGKALDRAHAAYKAVVVSRKL